MCLQAVLSSQGGRTFGLIDLTVFFWFTCITLFKFNEFAKPDA
jgi:hypothetical protein